MLDIRVTLEGDKIVIAGLQSLGQKINKATQRALTRAGSGIYGEAFRWLSGPGAKATAIPPGGYPVPVRTGHLRRSLNWLKPGATKTTNNLTVTAGQFESIIYDAASYADTIFSGKGTSEKYGPRDALKDGLARFNQGSRIVQILEEEIQKDLNNV